MLSWIHIIIFCLCFQKIIFPLIIESLYKLIQMRNLPILVKHSLLLVKLSILTKQLFECFLEKHCINIFIQFISPQSLNRQHPVFVYCIYLHNFFPLCYVIYIIVKPPCVDLQIYGSLEDVYRPRFFLHQCKQCFFSWFQFVIVTLRQCLPHVRHILISICYFKQSLPFCRLGIFFSTCFWF